MKEVFFQTLLEIAEQDATIELIVGDLGFGAVEPFAHRFPDRFLNVGVAEQNLAGIAAGMALSGRTVFTYSIGNFPTLRCLEQIRNDICYHRANVKIVAVGGGFAYGALGMSHHATEDLAIMRALPEMVTVAPGDATEVQAATRAIARHRGPCYLRLGRAGKVRIHDSAASFALGRAMLVRDGDDATLVTTGEMLEVGLEVARALEPEGIALRVLSMHTVKPVDEEAILDAARSTPAVFTVEEHSVIGGLGSAVAEVLAENCLQTPIVFRRFGLPSRFPELAGSQQYLREQHGLTAPAIAAGIREALAHGVGRSAFGGVDRRLPT